MARSVDDRMSFMEHLGELRTRIVRGLVALLPQIWKHQPRSRASVKPDPATRPAPRDPSAGPEGEAKADGPADPGGTELSVDSAK